MDKEVISDLYNRAKSLGYTKDESSFVNLLHSDEEVFNDMYNYVKSQGYQKDEASFSNLIGKSRSLSVEKGGVRDLTMEAKMPTLKTEVSQGKQERDYLKKKDLGEFSPTLQAKREPISEKDFKPIDPEKVEKAEYEFARRLQRMNNAVLFKQSEEKLVPQLQNAFGEYGFEFKEAFAGQDFVDIVAPNGKTIRVGSFIGDTNPRRFEQNKDKVLNFIEQNKPGVNVLADAVPANRYSERLINEFDKRYAQDVEMPQLMKKYEELASVAESMYVTHREEMGNITDEANELGEMYKNGKLSEKEFLSKLEGLANKAKSIDADYAERGKRLKQDMNGLDGDMEALKKSVGRYAEMNKMQQSFRGTLLRKFEMGMLETSASLWRTPEYIYDLAAYLVNLQPFVYAPTSKEIGESLGISNPYAGMLEARANELSKIETKYDGSITDYLMKGDYESAAKATAASISESLPFTLAIMGGSAAGASPSKMFGFVTGAMGAQRKQELDEDLTLSEQQRITNSLVYGMAESLEVLLGAGSFGRNLRKIAQREGMSKARQWGAKTVATLIDENPWLNPFKEGLQEMLTQTLQNIGDIVVLGEDKNVSDGLADAAIVGFAMGSKFTAVQLAAQKVSDINRSRSNAKYYDSISAISNDSEAFNSVVSELKGKLDKMQITEEEYNEQYNNLAASINAYRSMPTNLTEVQRRKVFPLLIEKQNLEALVKDVPVALVEKERDRIEDIDEELRKIVKQKDETSKVTAADAKADSELESAVAESEESETGEAEVDEEVDLGDEVEELLGKQLSTTETADRIIEAKNAEIDATAKALEGVGKKETKKLYSIGKKIYDRIFSDLDKKESEIKDFLNIDEKQRDKQHQLEKGKLDKLQRQYDRKQLTTESDINALEKQREKVELIENLLKSQKGAIADIDNQLAQYALEKYPDIFTKKETYPFYTAKGFDNVKNNIISEDYHKAKADGSNPELVAAVEELLGQKDSPSVQPPAGSVGVGGDVEVNKKLALQNAEKIDKGNGSHVKNMSMQELKELASDMVANEKEYQDKFDDAQGIYNLTTERIEELEQSEYEKKEANAKDKGDESMSDNYVSVLSENDFLNEHSERWFGKKTSELSSKQLAEAKKYTKDNFKGEGYYNEEMDDFVGSYEDALRSFWGDKSAVEQSLKETPQAGSVGVGGEVENIKSRYVKDGFEIQYERPDYIELLKMTDNSKNVGEFETRKIGEKITISLNEDGTIEVFSADYNINGGGLSGQAGKNKFYDLGEYKPVEQSLKETPKAPKKAVEVQPKAEEAGSVGVGGDVEAKKAEIERRRQEDLQKGQLFLMNDGTYGGSRLVSLEEYSTIQIQENNLDSDITKWDYNTFNGTGIFVNLSLGSAYIVPNNSYNGEKAEVVKVFINRTTKRFDLNNPRIINTPNIELVAKAANIDSKELYNEVLNAIIKYDAELALEQSTPTQTIEAKKSEPKESAPEPLSSEEKVIVESISKQLDVPKKEVSKVKQTNEKTTRKSKNIARVVKSEAANVENNRDVKRASEIVETIEATTDAILNNQKESVDFENKYKISVVDVAQSYNEMDKKNANLLDAYTSARGMTEQMSQLDFDEQIGDYKEFVEDFLRAAAGIKLKYPVEAETAVEVKIDSKPKKIKQQSTPKVLQQIVSKDDMWPSMKGVYYDGDNAVATDGHVLVVVKNKTSEKEIIDDAIENYYKQIKKTIPSYTRKQAEDYIKEQLKNGIDTKIISPKDGTVYDERFPNYQSVIPSHKNKIDGVDANELYAELNGAAMVAKNTQLSYYRIRGVEGDVRINPEFGRKVLEALISNGAKTITVEYADGNKGVVFRSDNGDLGLMMPVVFTEDAVGLVFVSDLLVGKETVKSEPQPQVEAPEAKPEKTAEKGEEKVSDAKKLADRIRSKKFGGTMVVLDFGISKTVYNGAIEFMAKQVEKGTKLGNAIANTIKWIDGQMQGAKWNKGAFAKYMNDTYTMKLNDGRTVEVVRDDTKETAEVINGWYQPIEQKILDTKQDKLPAKEWANRLRSKEGEDVWTGVREFLESKGNESVSKKELLDFMKDNRIEIVEVVKGDKVTMEEYQDRSIKYGEQNGLTVEFGSENEIFISILGEGEITEDEVRTESDRKRSAKTYDVSEESLVAANELFQENKQKRFGESSDDPIYNTKFSEHQLEGDKSNYKEVLVTLPRKPKDLYMAVERKGRKANGDVYDYYSVVRIDDPSQKGSNEVFYNIDDANKKAKALNANTANQIYEDKAVFKSSHFDEPNILVHLRMNTRTDSDGNKVLFLEEVQSDWGQQGKKEGFKTDKLPDNIKIKEVGGKWQVIKDGKLQGEYNSESRAKEIAMADFTIPTAPFVTETPSWVKLGLKTALKEAVAQGADKIAWTTGEQQFDRWGTEKIDWVKTDVTNPKRAEGLASFNSKMYDKYGKEASQQSVDMQDLYNQQEKEELRSILSLPTKLKQEGWTINIQEQFSGTAFEGMNVDEKALSESGVTINSKEDLKAAIDRNLSREKTETERQKLTDRIWDRMQKEESGTSLPRKEGMEGFYDKMLPSVAKAVVKELTGKEGVVGTTKFDAKSQYLFDENLNELSEEEKKLSVVTTQQSIDITPELKASVEVGLPLFGVAKARQEFERAKKRFDRESRNMQFGGFGALPAFIDYVKAFVNLKSAEFKEFLQQFRQDFPEMTFSDENIKNMFDNAIKAIKDVETISAALEDKKKIINGLRTRVRQLINSRDSKAEKEKEIRAVRQELSQYIKENFPDKNPISYNIARRLASARTPSEFNRVFEMLENYKRLIEKRKAKDLEQQILNEEKAMMNLLLAHEAERKKIISRIQDLLNPKTWQKPKGDSKIAKTKIDEQAKKDLHLIMSLVDVPIENMTDADLISLKETLEYAFKEGIFRQNEINRLRKLKLKQQNLQVLNMLYSKNKDFKPVTTVEKAYKLLKDGNIVVMGGKIYDQTMLQEFLLDVGINVPTIKIGGVEYIVKPRGENQFAISKVKETGEIVSALLPKDSPLRAEIEGDFKALMDMEMERELDAKYAPDRRNKDRKSGFYWWMSRMNTTTGFLYDLMKTQADKIFLEKTIENPTIAAEKQRTEESMAMQKKHEADRIRIFGRNKGKRKLAQNAITLTQRNGEEIKFDNAMAVYLYNVTQRPEMIRKFIDSGFDLDQLDRIYEHVLSDPQLKEYAKSLIDMYSSYLPNINKSLIAEGFSTIDPKVIPSLEKLSQKIGSTEAQWYYNRMAQVNDGVMPMYEPYSPASVTPENEASDGNLFDLDKDANVTGVISNNVIETKAGGVLKLENSETMFNNWTEGMTNMVAKLSLYSTYNGIFDKKVWRNLEAIYGKKYVANFKENFNDNLLGRSMKNPNQNIYSNWLNRASSVTMFVNIPSAIGQTISSFNFAFDAKDESLLMEYVRNMGKPLHDKDFYDSYRKVSAALWIKARMKGNLSSQELREIANNTSQLSLMVNDLLSKGYTPTRYVDAFAITAGGTPFYMAIRDRQYAMYRKTLPEKQAMEKAEGDALFALYKTANFSQQSSEQFALSKEQKNIITRQLLTFGSVNLQYNRIVVRAIRDIFNNRGNLTNNLAKIVFYMFLQNIVFQIYSKGLSYIVGQLRGEDDDEEIKRAYRESYAKVANSTFDTALRGFGAFGAITAVAKNAIYDMVVNAAHRKLEREKREEREWAKEVGADTKIADELESDLIEFLVEMGESRERISKLRGNKIVFESVRNLLPNFGTKMKSLEKTTDMFGRGEIVGATSEGLQFLTNAPTGRIYTLYEQVQLGLSDNLSAYERLLGLVGIFRKYDFMESERKEQQREEEAEKLMKDAERERKKNYKDWMKDLKANNPALYYNMKEIEDRGKMQPK
jgi:hypothetical protein